MIIMSTISFNLPFNIIMALQFINNTSDASYVVLMLLSMFYFAQVLRVYNYRRGK